MRLSARDYIKAMTAKTLFSPDAATPEWNPLVWEAYFALYDNHIGGVADIECVMTDEGAGFSLDPLNPAAAYGWALLAPVSHAPVPFTAPRLAAMAPDIADTFDRDGLAPFLVMTDTFEFAAPVSDPADRCRFAWLNSPRAAIMPSFDDYIASLASERRKQLRRLYRDYNDPDRFRFDFSAVPPGAAEMDFLAGHTALRWKEDSAYALNQVLWPVAASSLLPGSVRFMRVYHKNTLVFINTYMVRGDTIVSQSTTRNETEFFSGLGTMIDFKAIEILSKQNEIKYLDPTCRTCLDDPATIGVAKREVINRENARPVFALGDKDLINNPDLYNILMFDKNCGWTAPSEPIVMGRGL